MSTTTRTTDEMRDDAAELRTREANRTTAADTRAAGKVLDALVAAAESHAEADARRVLRQECDDLRAAVQTERHDHPRRYGDRAALLAAVAEARRVAAMYGVTV